MNPALMQRSLGPPYVKRLPDPPTFITQFQSGHGWLLNHALVNLNSTENPFWGTQCVKYGPGDPDANLELQSPQNLGLDLSGKELLVYFRSPDQNGAGWTIYLGDDNAFLTNRYYQVAGPVGQYARDEVCCVRIALSVSNGGTSDLTGINRIKIRLNNPSGEHTMYLYGVAYRASGGRYANGAVTFCYDDSGASLGALAYPLHHARSIPGIAYVIGETVETVGTPSETLLTMQADGWDIGGHADRGADHADMRDLTAAETRDALRRMKLWLLRHGFKGHHFAYPYGYHNATVRAETSRYFSSGREVGATTGTPNAMMVPAPTVNLYSITCPSFATTGANVAEMKAAIDKAYTNKLWAPLLFHTVIEGTSSGASINQNDLAGILDYAITKGVSIVTMSEMFGLL